MKDVPISSKFVLSQKEASVYSNIGLNKIDELLRKPDCPFVLYVGKKRLVKRIPFKNCLTNHNAIEKRKLPTKSIEIRARTCYTMNRLCIPEPDSAEMA